jgi:hypothetical protein
MRGPAVNGNIQAIIIIGGKGAGNIPKKATPGNQDTGKMITRDTNGIKGAGRNKMQTSCKKKSPA